MKLRKEITCPLELTHDLIRGKWKPIILWTLKEPQSLSSLEKGIVGITEKMLLEHLGELVAYGIVAKKKSYGYPLQVEYSLTDRGSRLVGALEILQEVGTALLQDDSLAGDEYPQKSG